MASLKRPWKMTSGVDSFEQPGAKDGIAGPLPAILPGGREGFLSLPRPAADAQGIAVLAPGTRPEVRQPHLAPGFVSRAGLDGDLGQLGEMQGFTRVLIPDGVTAVDQRTDHSGGGERLPHADLADAVLGGQGCELGQQDVGCLTGRQVGREEGGDRLIRAGERTAIVVGRRGFRFRRIVFGPELEQAGEALRAPAHGAQAAAAVGAIAQQMPHHLSIPTLASGPGGAPQKSLEIFGARMIFRHRSPPGTDDPKHQIRFGQRQIGRGWPMGSTQPPPEGLFAVGSSFRGCGIRLPL